MNKIKFKNGWTIKKEKNSINNGRLKLYLLCKTKFDKC